MSGKERDVPAEKVLDGLSERLSAIDFRPSAGPRLAAPPSVSSDIDGFLDKLKGIEESLDAAAAERRETFASFSALVQARLAALPSTQGRTAEAPAEAPKPTPALPAIPDRLRWPRGAADAPAVPEIGRKAAVPPAEPVEAVKPVEEPRAAEEPPKKSWLSALLERKNQELARQRVEAPEPAAEPAVERRAEPVVVRKPEPVVERKPEPVVVEPQPEPVVEAALPVLEAPAVEAAPAAAAIPAPGPRRAALLSIAAALVAGAAVAALHFFHRMPQHRAFPFAVVRSAGLALAGDRLIALDPERQLLFFISTRDGEISAIHKIPTADFVRVAAGPNALWAGTRAGKLAAVALDADHAVTKTFELGLRPSGPLWLDGESLWLSDPATRSIRRFKLGDKAQEEGKYSFDAAPAALAVADGLLWTLDGASGRLTRWRPGEPLVPVDAADLKPFLGGAVATGLAVAADDVWISAENPPGLHRFARARLAFTTRPTSAP